MHLRPYQAENLAELRAALRVHQSALYVSPCGSGKGTVITYIVNSCVQKNKAVIFAVHGKALVHDMSERVTRLGIKHGVLLGGHRRERWHGVQVASIDTLHRMPHPPAADILIVDEAHLSLSPTWRKTIDRYSGAKIIGMTATPIRLDKKGLGRKSGGLFDAMVVGPTEQELIALEYLVPSRVLAPPPPPDLGKLKKIAGEFNPKEQSQVCDKAKVIGDIVTHWKQHASGRKTAVFGVDQAHANHIAEQFRESGVNWAYVDAETSEAERARIWRDLDDPSGNLMGVASCGITTVGWDHPIVSCLIAARKTASLGLWRQMLGRGSRIYRGKENFIVLDHVGNTHYHHPFGMFEDPVDWQLDGEAVKIKEGDDAAPQVKTCKHSYLWPDKRHDPPKIVRGVQLPCYATFRAGPKECPYCGLTIMVQARKVEVEAGELQEVRGGVSGLGKTDGQSMLAYYDDLRKTSAKKGYKPGFVGMSFKSRFGFWPPKNWESRRVEGV